MPHPLVVEALCIQRGGRAILAGCNLEVAAGEGVAIMGSSGAGKSTLLWSLLGLLVPDSGVVRVMGQIMTGRASRRATIRRDHMGMVFQQAELLPELTIVENVALPLLLSPRPPQDAYDRAHVLLTRLGIEPGTSVSALSGGEQQRVAVARALVNEPQVLLADEPTGSLDAVNTREVLDLLLEVTSSQGCALVVVTHDQNVAAAMGRTVTLERGALMSGN